MTRRSGVRIDDAWSASSRGEPSDWWPSRRTTPSSSHGEETPTNCAGSLDCSIVIDDSPAVTAVFMPKPQLSVTVNGPVGSRVVSDPEGIDCKQTDAGKRDNLHGTLRPRDDGEPDSDTAERRGLPRCVGRQMLGEQGLPRTHDRIRPLFRDRGLRLRRRVGACRPDGHPRQRDIMHPRRSRMQLASPPRTRARAPRHRRCGRRRLDRASPAPGARGRARRVARVRARPGQ